MLQKQTKLVRASLISLAVLLLAACSTTHTIVTDTSCQVLNPITYSGSKDTPETIQQIREHNAVWDSLCK